MGSIEVSHVGYKLPGGRMLLHDVSFRVGDGEKVALVGANGVGKTTLLRLIAGEDAAAAGTITVGGRLGVMHQFIGSSRPGATVRDLLLSLSEPEVRTAAKALRDAEADGDGMRLAKAHASWGDAGGYAAEVLWDTCTTVAVGATLDEVGHRPASTLSGGEQKRLAVEMLLRGEADVLVLDEPDNYLDIPGKEWLEEALNASRKTVLLVSHDRELLANAAAKIVTLEARGAWTHGGTFATWAEARQARLERIDEEHRRWQEERKRLEDQVRELRQRLQVTDKFASRLQATKTKIRRLEAAPPPERPKDQEISVRLGGDRTGKRAVTVEGVGFPGIVEAFDTEVLFGERVAVLGRNGTGKTHFLELLAGRTVEHTGSWRLGARVVPGWFSQTHDRPGLSGKSLRDVLGSVGLTIGAAMSSLRRYGLHTAADQSFDTLSGGQQARFQILLLETSGATLLLLDEPTDNLDVASAEALEEALSTFVGTVIAVTHDRWFLRSFDRFLVFGRDGAVTESLEPAWD